MPTLYDHDALVFLLGALVHLAMPWGDGLVQGGSGSCDTGFASSLALR